MLVALQAVVRFLLGKTAPRACVYVGIGSASRSSAVEQQRGTETDRGFEAAT